jgi:hypothetical protein
MGGTRDSIPTSPDSAPKGVTSETAPALADAPTAPAPVAARRTASGASVLGDEDPAVFEQRTAARLRDLMRALVRALKAKKMYPANNPVLGRILSELQDAVMGMLEDLEELTLKVEQADLLYAGTSVYHNPGKRESLAWRFHRDGITEITFGSGLTPPELNAFLDVLARATEMQGVEDDLVTMLWEQEFSHIRYAYLAIEDLQENLLEGVEPGEGEVDGEEREVPWPGANSSGFELIVEAPDATGEGSGERSDDWNELNPTVDITERCPAHLLELTPQELQDLAEEIHLEHSRPLTELALEILTEVAEDERNADRFADLARAMAELVVIALADTDLTRATQVLATLRALSSERGVDPAGFLAEPGDLVRQAIAGVHHFPDADTSSLPEFLAHLGPDAIDPVCDLLEDRSEEAMHPQLAAALSLLAPQAIAAVRDRLASATGAPAAHILAALAATPTPEALGVLAQAIEHSEPRVRREALAALLRRGAATKPEVRERIARALQDDDAQVRTAALTVARECPGDDMGARLLAIVESPRFRERAAAEKKSYFDALARIHNPLLRKSLREWAAAHLWWPSASGAERRTLAAWALAQGGTEEDLAFLARHAQSIFPGVRTAARRALAERRHVPVDPMGHGREGRAA